MFTPVLATVPALAVIGRGGGRGPGFLFPLLLLVLLGGLAAWLINRRRGGSPRATPSGPAPAGPSASGQGSAMEMLQQRFARGDIDQAEYEHRKAVLVGADHVPPRSGDAGGSPTTPSGPAPGADVDPTTEIEPEQ